MKNILLLVHDDAGQEARLQTALDLTRALDGHLTCLDVALPPVIVSDAYPGPGAASLLLDEREVEEKNKHLLTARLADENVSWSWTDNVGNIADRILHHASLADLIVLNRRLDSISYPDMLDIASRVVTHARVPVVAVNEASRGFPFKGRALVAWDGRETATAALRASVPLLRLAEEVKIFTATDRKRPVDIAAAAEYLSRHDIHATVHTIDRNGNTPDELIHAEAQRWNAGYVVMGAYSRGRLAETFGGVTRRMLSSSPLPLVLGH